MERCYSRSNRLDTGIRSEIMKKANQAEQVRANKQSGTKSCCRKEKLDKDMNNMGQMQANQKQDPAVLG